MEICYEQFGGLRRRSFSFQIDCPATTEEQTSIFWEFLSPQRIFFTAEFIPEVSRDSATGENKRHSSALLNLARQFRMLPRPVVGRISDGRYLLDMRCLRDEHEFVDQLSALNVH